MDLRHYRRTVAAAALAVVLVGVGGGAVLAHAGSPPAQAAVGGLIVGLFALVVVPLAVIARRVGAAADDPDALERRVGLAAGRSDEELDALATWDERPGRLDDEGSSGREERGTE